jgi:hypothetical protein
VGGAHRGRGKTAVAAPFSVAPMAPRRPEWTGGHQREMWTFAHSCIGWRRCGEIFYHVAPVKTFKGGDGLVEKAVEGVRYGWGARDGVGEGAGAAWAATAARSRLAWVAPLHRA